MDEIKSKFLDLIHKQNRHVKIPSMGFSEHFIHNLASGPVDQQSQPASGDKANQLAKQHSDDFRRLPDQEILDGTEAIYFQENVNCEEYELRKFTDTKLDYGTVEQAMMVLKQQHKVVSKKVLQNILDQRTACNEEFTEINETQKQLNESLLVCANARSYLSFARTNLTTTSLEILATYKKRETLQGLVKTLHTLKRMKSTETQLQLLLSAGNYSAAIEILLECRTAAAEYEQYACVEALSLKLQDTMMLTELQLDNVLNEMTQSFDMIKYSKLQEAYKLLGKTLIAMDQLHMNFISAIHTTAFTVLRNHNDPSTDERQQKMLFEQMCENVPADKYIPCLISMCKSFWCILVCYYQVTMWHQNVNLFEKDLAATAAAATPITTSEPTPNYDEYIQQKFKNGQSRIWNDIQSKCCVYLSSTKLHNLKYEQFIQVLSIVQRLKKVGFEFCGEQSVNLMESMRAQSMSFFKRYHAASLEEICLFLDNEAWVPVTSFSSIVQLQEYRSVRKSLKRYFQVATTAMTKNAISELPVVPSMASRRPVDETASSVHSQDGSSIYGSCGYFYRFAEKSSPFDGGFDEAMLEEDILAGIADESSCYFSEESEEERSAYDSNRTERAITDADTLEQTVAVTAIGEIADCVSAQAPSAVIVNNTSLNVLRCIGRYLQMCKLLHSISPHIVACMAELIDFYTYAVHDVFGNDLPVPGENLYTPKLTNNLRRIGSDIIPKVKTWPPSFSMIQMELCNPDSMYGLQLRIVGVESCVSLVMQFQQLRGYLEHLLPLGHRNHLNEYLIDTVAYICDIRKPVFMCVTARAIDLQNVLTAMGKVKWDINDVNVEHSIYVDSVNRGMQMFAMRLEEIGVTPFPKDAIWDSLAHVLTHTFVEGYANAKKCTAGGRALMQLDFAHFMSILKLLSANNHPVHHAYVDAYIKAFYMPKDLLEQWCREQRAQRTYSVKHLTTLIQCTCSNDKKTRQRLMLLVEQSDSITSTSSTPNGSP